MWVRMMIDNDDGDEDDDDNDDDDRESMILFCEHLSNLYGRPIGEK